MGETMEDMNLRREYLEKLRRALESNAARLPQNEIEDILRDTSEHFEHALSAGKSTEAVIAALGAPGKLAEGYTAQSLIKSPPPQGTPISSGSLTLFRVMKTVFILAPANFFMFLGPFLIMVSFVVAGWFTAFAIGAVSLWAAGQFLTAGMGAGAGVASVLGLAVLFFVLGVFGAAVTGLLVMLKISEWTFRLIWSWLRWNLNFFMAS